MTNDPLNEVIRQSAMLVSLHTKSWTARARDDKASAAAAAEAGADKRAYSTHKNLMFGADKRLKAVKAAQVRVRNMHDHMTLPWGSKGVRMLPVTQFQEYMGEIGKLKQEFKDSLDEFLEHYEADRDYAMGLLNITGNESIIYPTKNRLEEMFSTRVEMQPIPAGAQFKGLPDNVAKQLEENYEERLAEKMKAAMQAALVRSRDTLNEFSERVMGVRMHQRSWLRVEEIPEMIDRFNVTSDEELMYVSDKVRDELSGVYSYDDCRKKALKGQISETAQNLAQFIEYYIEDEDMEVDES